jgi:hypothetical protein
MGCNSSSILKKNTQVKLTPNDFVDFVIDRFNFKELLDKDISFQGEDYFWNDIQFNANNISFFPHFMIKIINLRINNFDDFFCKDNTIKREECVICMENSENVKNIKCCKKSFHEDCFKKWINQYNQDSCPCCRQKIDTNLTIVRLKCTSCKKLIYYHNPKNKDLSNVCCKCI